MTFLDNINLQDFDFSVLFQPGLYQIVNIKTQKIYYGESQNIAVRFSQHFSQLQAGIHWNAELQKDLNQLDSVNFKWQILEIGLDWSDSVKRQLKEKEFIQASKNKVYNKLTPTFLTNTIPPSANAILGNGQLYRTLKEAAKQNNITQKKALKLLEKDDSGWSYLESEAALKKKNKYQKVSKRVKVNDIIFPSVSAAARFFDVTAQTVHKRIGSANFSNWLWVDEETKKRINPGPKRKRPVKIEGQIFQSLADAS